MWRYESIVISVHLQIQRWGNVEWQHDIEAQDLKSRMAASLLIASLSQR